MTKEGKEQDGQNGQEVDEFPKITNYIRTKVSMEIVQKSNCFFNLLDSTHRNHASYHSTKLNDEVSQFRANHFFKNLFSKENYFTELELLRSLSFLGMNETRSFYFTL